ncbi:hypothetical protein D1007_18625 [Hordeum vulgare]|nr:hypothetical protein D1007_18625 [Hordeum vulgare]
MLMLRIMAWAWAGGEWADGRASGPEAMSAKHESLSDSTTLTDLILALLRVHRCRFAWHLGHMPPENVNKLASIAGLSSPSQLQLPDAELQAILEELAGSAS